MPYIVSEELGKYHVCMFHSFAGCSTPNTEQTKTLNERLEQGEKQTRSASNILRQMTNSKDPRNKRELENQTIACHNILRTHGIPPITNLLLCDIDRIRYNAIATIHSLLLCLDESKIKLDIDAPVGDGDLAKHAIRESKGVELMVELLKSDNAKLLTILTDCLRILATKNQETKDAILSRNGPNLLVEILKGRNFEYKNLVLMTARLLKGKT